MTEFEILVVESAVRSRNRNYDKMHIVLLILLVLFNPCVSKADEKGFSFIYAADSPGKIVIFDSDGKSAWEYPAEMARDVWKLPDGKITYSIFRTFKLAGLPLVHG